MKSTDVERSADIDAIADRAVREAASDQFASDMLEIAVWNEVGECDRDVRSSLMADIVNARSDVERDHLQRLLDTRHDWLAGAIRDNMTAARTPCPEVREADRLWAAVAAERSRSDCDEDYLLTVPF